MACVLRFVVSFVGEDTKYSWIQEKPLTLSSHETESLLERRNSKCTLYCIDRDNIHATKVTYSSFHVLIAIFFSSFAAPDEVQNTEGLFTVLNEFWAAELADILLPREQVSLGDPLCRGMHVFLCRTLVLLLSFGLCSVINISEL